MKAAVLYGPGQLRVEEVACPAPGPGEALVKVCAAGVCSSDLYRVLTGNVVHLPIVLGHEFAGIVTKTGKNTQVKPGLRVAVYPLLWCGRCESCRRGMVQCCTNYSYHGSRTDGGLAEFVVTRTSNLVTLSDELTWEEGAMVEPAGVALHALNRAMLQPGEGLTVVGAGTIGLIAAQLARACGANPVIVLDLLQAKLTTARNLGFDKLIPADSPDVVDRVKSLGGGNLPPVVLEAAGTPSSYNLAIELAPPRGRIIVIGNLTSDLLLARNRASLILRRELSILGTWNANPLPPRNEWHRVIEMLQAHEIELAPLISHHLRLEELPGCLQHILEEHKSPGKVMVGFTSHQGR